jgi:hypothetical protein
MSQMSPRQLPRRPASAPAQPTSPTASLFTASPGASNRTAFLQSLLTDPSDDKVVGSSLSDRACDAGLVVTGPPETPPDRQTIPSPLRSDREVCRAALRVGNREHRVGKSEIRIGEPGLQAGKSKPRPRKSPLHVFPEDLPRIPARLWVRRSRHQLCKSKPQVGHPDPGYFRYCGRWAIRRSESAARSLRPASRMFG